jgi:AraC-like DNA-binding protein
MAIGPLYRTFVQLAKERGVDVESVLGKMGMTEAQALAPTYRLSPESGRALAWELIRLSGDAEIGLMAAERFNLADLDLIGYMARNTGSPLAALEAFARYARLLGDTAHCAVRRSGGVVVITAGRTGGRDVLPEVGDFIVGVVGRVVADLCGAPTRPIEVRLPRPRPRHPDRYARFFGTRVVFGAECGALLYPEAALKTTVPKSDARLGEILRRQADDALLALPATFAFAERVRAELERHLEDGEFDVPRIAELFGMSERTLRRRLTASGQSYRALLDDARRQRALALAHEGRHSVTRIAGMVGFGDATSFTRAFRRWTGVAPQRYLLASHRR